jgi:hypothetical protein
VDPNYTFPAKVAKAYLPRADAYGATHEKLRGVGRSYLDDAERSVLLRDGRSTVVYHLI